jgi:hypothetical protein
MGPSRRAGMNKPVNDDWISRVFPKKTNQTYAIETGFPEGDLSFRVRSTRLNIDNYFSSFH